MTVPEGHIKNVVHLILSLDKQIFSEVWMVNEFLDMTDENLNYIFLDMKSIFEVCSGTE